MVAGKRTPREVEECVVELARQGKTARETSDASGVPIDTVRKIVRRTPGVTWAHPPGSNGTPEGAAVARGYRSAYARNRRNELAEQLLDQIARANQLAMNETDPRKFQALMQAADAATRAYNVITKTDQAGDGGAERAKSVMGALIVKLAGNVGDNGAREGLVTE